MFTVEQRNGHPDFGGHSAMCGTCGAGIGYVFACGDDPHPRLREMWNRRATAGEQRGSAGVTVLDHQSFSPSATDDPGIGHE
jgi:hypothetical protein